MRKVNENKEEKGQCKFPNVKEFIHAFWRNDGDSGC